MCAKSARAVHYVVKRLAQDRNAGAGLDGCAAICRRKARAPGTP